MLLFYIEIGHQMLKEQHGTRNRTKIKYAEDFRGLSVILWQY
jgi:hypothetical protein